MHTATSGGTALFYDSGQRLGDADTLAVALGDLDGDGDLDAFVGNDDVALVSKGQDRIWVNDGTANFTEHATLAASRTQDVALGDLDGDGDLDAAVATKDGANLVYVNDGVGRFSDSGDPLGLADSPGLALGDLDGDGDLDAFLLSISDGGQVWKNDGDFMFRRTQQEIGVGSSTSVALGDVDSDGDLDALVGGNTRLLLNDGDGHFEQSEVQFKSASSGRVALADFDGDGDVDAYLDSRGIWRNDGQGQFEGPSQPNAALINRQEVALGDVDGDGDLDIAEPADPIRLWLNDGNANLQPTETQLQVNASLALGDLDGDGDLDVFRGMQGTSNQILLNADLLVDLSITNTNESFFVVPGQTVNYTVRVTNNGLMHVDGVPIVNSFSPQLTNVMWTCSATAGSSCTPEGAGDIHDTVSLTAGGVATYEVRGVVSADASHSIKSVATILERDPNPDNNTATDVNVVLPLWVSPPSNSLAQARNTEVIATTGRPVDPTSVNDGTFVVHGSQSGRLLEPPNGIVTDQRTITRLPGQTLHTGELVEVSFTRHLLDADGVPFDPFVWRFTAGATGGTGLFGDTGQQLLVDGSAHDAELGDVDGDGDLDFLFAGGGATAPRNSLWLNNGDGTFLKTGQEFGDVGGSDVVLGDIDGDGDLDAIMGRYGAGDASVGALIWRNLGDGTFRGAGRRIGTKEVSHLALGDVDGDGDLDALVGTRSRRGESFDELWLNDGNGDFHDSGQRLGPASQAVALADIDGDGDLDAMVRNRQVHAWLNDGSGTFAATSQPIGPIGVREIIPGDLDAEGDVDLLAGGALLLNNGAGMFAESVQTMVTPSRESVLADVDGDHNLDIVDPGHSQIWLNDGRGGFEHTIPFGSRRPNLYRKTTMGDVDGDGDIDALLMGAGEVRVWLNADVPTDLSISINSRRHVVVAGDSVMYRIHATNQGAVDLRNVQLSASLPPQVGELAWSCQPSPRSACPPNGVGPLRTTADLAAGGAVEFVLTGQLEPDYEGVLTATANVSASEGIQDMVLANNFASDTDVVHPIGVSPHPGSHSAGTDDEITVVLTSDVNPQTVFSRSLVVNGLQSASSLDDPDQIVVDGPTISYARPKGFHAGESIQVTATSNIKSASGEDSLPRVWQFRAGPDSGTGFFRDSGQLLNGTPRRIALGDVDGDGDLDALTCEASDGRAIWLNDGNGQFQASPQTLNNFAAVAVADVDGDGDLDAVGTLSGGTAEIWRNDGLGAFTPDPGRVETMSSRELAFGDVDADGDLDLVVGEAVELWRNDGTGRFTKSLQQFEWGAFDLAFADMDADGDLDLFFGGQNRLWLNDGAGNFSPGQYVLGPYRENDTAEPGMAQLGDIDNDGDPDIAVGINHIWINDGAARFQRIDPTHLDQYDEDIQVLGDFDSDGDLDMVGGDSLWLNDGVGHFTRRSLGAFVSRATVGDVNNDGALDILLLDYRVRRTGATRVWFNNAMPRLAVWDGTQCVGNVGDGRSWGDANNWSVDGNPDELPKSELPGDRVVFPAGTSDGPIQLNADRTVSSLLFQGQTTLQGHALDIITGQVHVSAGASATIESRFSSREVIKSGEGELAVPNLRTDFVAQSGTLHAGGSIINFVVQPAGTLSPGVGVGSLTYDGYMHAVIDGTLLVELAGENSDQLVGFGVTLGQRSRLRVAALAPLTQAAISSARSLRAVPRADSPTRLARATMSDMACSSERPITQTRPLSIRTAASSWLCDKPLRVTPTGTAASTRPTL